MTFSLEKLKNVLNKKGYHFFENNSPYKINIIGIRSNSNTVNLFDDWLYLIYKDITNTVKVHKFSITTDPGIYWLKNPSRSEGTAILIPGQYIDSYTIGLHRGKYEALTQQKPLKIWRDRNKDHTINKEGRVFEGIFGINIHRSNANTQSWSVDKWSAGCQVFQKVADFNFFMDICKKSKQQNFTYTLLEEMDFQLS